MNKLLIEIAKRLVCKAIKVNTEKYNMRVCYDYIGTYNSIGITIFNGKNCISYYLYDRNEWNNKDHLRKFRMILRKIRKREL